ncbi:sensor histidine kinase [Mangrovibacillus cuniculi]|uniref:histidine kinase n=1 Tax=Mangrovibacillus cuniculi TaxID=2593652 RepID=A0A7S8CCI8_9BACI|nr:sensor histidine kinase [Mangrovibacillus cuniculi]QPC47293.1 sensor histidine kinase [Mangrovibacillus cuniculi]
MVRKKLSDIQAKTGISPYIWMILFILPFYFIFQLESPAAIVAGILLTVLFFLFYRIALRAKRWGIYVWGILLMGISIASTSLFSYIYFAFFLAHFIGNIKNRVPFLTLYFIHLVSTSIIINISIVQQDAVFLRQFPFVVIIWIAVILLPFSIHNRNERDVLTEKLEDANKRISDLSKLEERQRIARDLHDTLGQKLSLIGMKSDLARKLVTKNPEQAKQELKDVGQTARTALNEVRKMVSSMREVRLQDELLRVEQLLTAANITLIIHQTATEHKLSPLTENILSMCLREAVTNVVKHSLASRCEVSIDPRFKDVQLVIRDNGMFQKRKPDEVLGSGILGMKERVAFVNGSISIDTENGTEVTIVVPNDAKPKSEEK